MNNKHVELEQEISDLEVKLNRPTAFTEEKISFENEVEAPDTIKELFILSEILKEKYPEDAKVDVYWDKYYISFERKPTESELVMIKRIEEIEEEVLRVEDKMEPEYLTFLKLKAMYEPRK